jgi:hypothetical protein
MARRMSVFSVIRSSRIARPAMRPRLARCSCRIERPGGFVREVRPQLFVTSNRTLAWARFMFASSVSRARYLGRLPSNPAHRLGRASYRAPVQGGCPARKACPDAEPARRCGTQTPIPCAGKAWLANNQRLVCHRAWQVRAGWWADLSVTGHSDRTWPPGATKGPGSSGKFGRISLICTEAIVSMLPGNSFDFKWSARHPISRLTDVSAASHSSSV